MTKKEVIQERRDKLLDFMRNLPAEKFKIDSVVLEINKNQCGTVCCVEGWLPAVFPGSFKWSIGDPEDSWTWGVQGVNSDEFFSVPKETMWDRIFCPGAYPLGQEVTPKMATARLMEVWEEYPLE